MSCVEISANVAIVVCNRVRYRAATLIVQQLCILVQAKVPITLPKLCHTVITLEVPVVGNTCTGMHG